eukprot:GFUD01033978.1.p1 GENE.GFUD01033978.1~~GFUD01033978.1.p1  ORF type:complete len:250 (+),score=47.25 GFUD01033978.1:31-780(+)
MMNFHLHLIVLLPVVQSIVSGPNNQLTEYYEVKAKGANFDWISGFYENQSKEHNNFSLYLKVNDRFPLYRNDNGKWAIGTNKNGAGNVRSTSTGMPAPPNKGGWEFWNSASKSWENDSSISVLPFKYPDTYRLEYFRDDENVKKSLEKSYLVGDYEKVANLLENGVPYYVKPEPDLIYLFRTETRRWTFSSTLRLTDQSDKFGFMYQERMKEPAPREDLPWKLKIGKTFVTTTGLSYPSRMQRPKKKKI